MIFTFCSLQVQCFPLFSVLKALDNPQVDYFSLDIEGAEFQVLKTLPWSQVNIRLLGIEVLHAGQVFDGDEDDISKLLDANGYKYVDKAGHDKFFLKRNQREEL